jgi:hypothetical protein
LANDLIVFVHQVAVQPTPCVEWELKPPANGQVNCLPNDEGNGLNCLISCAQGFRFTDGETAKTYSCQQRDPWKPSRVVPDCVPEGMYTQVYSLPLFFVFSFSFLNFSQFASGNTCQTSGCYK